MTCGSCQIHWVDSTHRGGMILIGSGTTFVRDLFLEGSITAVTDQGTDFERVTIRGDPLDATAPTLLALERAAVRHLQLIDAPSTAIRMGLGRVVDTEIRRNQAATATDSHLTPLVGGIVGAGEVERVRISGLVRGPAIYVDGPKNSIHLTDVTIGPNPSSPQGTAGGVVANFGAKVTLERVWISGVQTSAVRLIGGAGGLSGSDLDIDTIGPSDGRGGVGISAHLGAAIDLRRLRVRNVSVAGVWSQGGKVALDHVQIGDVLGGAVGTISQGVVDQIGDGILVVDVDEFSVTRALIERCARATFLAASSTGSLTDSALRRSELGLVTVGDKTDVVTTGSVFAENRDHNILTDGDFVVPEGPPL